MVGTAMPLLTDTVPIWKSGLLKSATRVRSGLDALLRHRRFQQLESASRLREPIFVTPSIKLSYKKGSCSQCARRQILVKLHSYTLEVKGVGVSDNACRHRTLKTA